MDDQEIIETIRVQNELCEESREIHMRILKKGIMIKKRNEQEGRRSEEDGTLIIETDGETHKKLVENGKLNLGWRRCRVYDFVSVLRCFKCWGYNHMTKHCENHETCQFCAGRHNGKDCKSTEKRCINCMEWSIRHKNNKTKDDHGAMDKECPVYLRRIREEKGRKLGEEE
ncbi:hypothetical protein RF55_14429 [Lasius niger]|uniref:Uncharacterized protein n=1 Tax=Lasius niger TaxID=67767 RepID=A0A0J7K8E1_LASNI|nr:hypothetical protein RF55_14429 [Lasius niger]